MTGVFREETYVGSCGSWMVDRGLRLQKRKEQDIQYQNEMFSASYYNRTIPVGYVSPYTEPEPCKDLPLCLHLSMIFHLTHFLKK